MKSRLPKNKDFDLWLLLLQARDTLLKARYKELKQYGISPMEAGVLFFVQTIGDKAFNNFKAKPLGIQIFD